MSWTKKPKIRLVVYLFAAFFFLYALLSNAQRLGDIFFGKYSSLYNVNLAQIFFRYSAYPFTGKAVPYAHYQLSRTYFIQGNLAQALSEIQKELQLYPNHYGSYYIMGLTYGYLNQEKDAVEAFSKFIEHEPYSWAARNDKAWLQFRTGDVDGALITIAPVTFDVNNPWIQNTYGTLLLNKKKHKEAKRAFLYAQTAAANMTEESWGKAYPGNDPRVYSTGLRAMRLSIENNLQLVNLK